MWWIGLLIAIVFFFLCVRFTIVEEGTAKIIKRFGGVVKAFIQWTGYYKDTKGNVVPDEEKIPKRRWYGGLRVWIGTPWDKVHKYTLRWYSIEEVEGKRAPVLHKKEAEEAADSIMLRPDRYWRKATELETKDGYFPDVEWLIGMRSENPEKTAFKAPHDWVENGLTELEPTLRVYSRAKTLTELLDLTRQQIWRDIGDDPAIQTVLKDEWGIKIDKEEIGIFAVTLPPAYQEALAAETKAEMEAKAVRKKGEVEADGRAFAIMRTVVSALSNALGLSNEEIQKQLRETPKEFLKKYEPLVTKTWEAVINKLSMEDRAYLRIETPGATGALGDILKMIGTWWRMPMGTGAGEKREEKRDKAEEKKEEEKEEKKEEKEEKPTKKEKTMEEIVKEMDELDAKVREKAKQLGIKMK